MDYRQLEYFLSVCEFKSISRAAQTAYVSQQAVSRSVANLEEELGVQLFERTPDGVILTDAGKTLQLKAVVHLRERDEIIRSMRNFHEQPGICISYFTGLLNILPAHFFPDFQKKYPNIAFSYISYNDNFRGRDFIDRESDMIISTTPLNISDYTLSGCVKRKIGIVFSRENKLRPCGRISLRDLKGIRLITINNETRSQRQLIDALKNHGLSIDSMLGETEWGLVHDLIRQGCASFYAGETRKLPDDLCLIYIDDLELYWELDIYINRRAKYPDIINELAAAVQTVSGAQ